MGRNRPARMGWGAAHFHNVSWWRKMNRTRKIAAAAVGTAVILVVFAMVLLNPTLHTQTPVSTSPPPNGGTGSGDSGATGTSNSTTTGCNVTASNQTGENGDHDGGASSTCGDLSVDHDAMGDRMSSEHRSLAADEHMHSGLEADVLALAQLGMTWTTSAVHGMTSLGTSFVGWL